MSKIRLILARPHGHSTSVEISDDQVTQPMLDAAEDLLHTLTTGERRLPEGFYEVLARAFGTTRIDAKKRLLGAAYGKQGTAVPPAPEKAPEDPST